MLTGKIPVYILLSHQDARGIFDALAEAGPITTDASDSGIRSVPEAIDHASNLDKDHEWYQHYIIIVDRPRWKSVDGVLVINMDFEGGSDGLRMPASEAAINISSMSIGNTDWEEYIATSRSRYTRVPENWFALYIDRAIPDTENVLGFARTLIDGGFKGRKKNLGSLCCPMEEEIRPSDVEEVGRRHRSIAEKLGCNGQFGCFIEFENWSFNEEKARVFRVQSDGQLDSFIMDVDMTGETLNSVVVGSSSWEDEKAHMSEPFITK